ncbi:hypothetical protein MCAMS1_02256 [biofilm metagenome]
MPYDIFRSYLLCSKLTFLNNLCPSGFAVENYETHLSELTSSLKTVDKVAGESLLPPQLRYTTFNGFIHYFTIATNMGWADNKIYQPSYATT